MKRLSIMKKLTSYTIALFSAFAAHTAFAESCVQPVSLTYDVSLKEKKGQIAIHRNGREMLRENLQTGVVEYWYHSPAGPLKLIRYVDSEKHGIEYQAEDFRGNESEVWKDITLAVPTDSMKTMTLMSEEGSGCDVKEIYTSEGGKELVWLPEKNILISYKAPGVSWQIKDQNESVFKERLAVRDNYILIDYADIGDSEEDPFVKKMIRWGFVEHGASGFYDEHGHAIQGHGHSH